MRTAIITMTTRQRLYHTGKRLGSTPINCKMYRVSGRERTEKGSPLPSLTLRWTVLLPQRFFCSGMMPTKRTRYSRQALLPEGSYQSHFQPLVHHHYACHTCAILSSPPETICLPSGDQATAYTRLAWPR